MIFPCHETLGLARSFPIVDLLNSKVSWEWGNWLNLAQSNYTVQHWVEFVTVDESVSTYA
jgi:hypothetical protein